MAHAIEDMLHHKVAINITNEKIFDGGYGGSFGSSPKQFNLAIGGRLGFETFIHEYNHFRQMVEDPQFWRSKCRSIVKLWEYLEGTTEDPKVDKYISDAIDLEHDCETRSLQMITEWNLPVKKRHYCKCSNAYLFVYPLVRHYGFWPTKPMYTMKSIVNFMPNRQLPSETFKDISNVPQVMFRYFDSQL